MILLDYANIIVVVALSNLAATLSCAWARCISLLIERLRQLRIAPKARAWPRDEPRDWTIEDKWASGRCLTTRRTSITCTPIIVTNTPISFQITPHFSNYRLHVLLKWKRSNRKKTIPIDNCLNHIAIFVIGKPFLSYWNQRQCLGRPSKVLTIIL